MVAQASKRCLFFVKMARAGKRENKTLPALLLSCGCDLTAECLPAREMVRVRFPAAAPILSGCASARGRVSKTQLTPGGTEAACQFSWGRGRQVMHLPCKQAYVGALPTDSTSLRPLRCGGRRVPRRSSESEGGLYRTAMRGFGSAGQFQLRETRPMHRGEPHKLI